MGQYFRIVNLDKREWFDPGDFGETEKHPDRSPKTMAAFGRLLMTSSFPTGGFDDGTPFPPTSDGRWCGDRVVILGDYARMTLDVREGPAEGSAIYEAIDEDDSGWTNIASTIGGKT